MDQHFFLHPKYFLNTKFVWSKLIRTQKQVLMGFAIEINLGLFILDLQITALLFEFLLPPPSYNSQVQDEEGSQSQLS